MLNTFHPWEDDHWWMACPRLRRLGRRRRSNSSRWWCTAWTSPGLGGSSGEGTRGRSPTFETCKQRSLEELDELVIFTGIELKVEWMGIWLQRGFSGLTSDIDTVSVQENWCDSQNRTLGGMDPLNMPVPARKACQPQKSGDWQIDG